MTGTEDREQRRRVVYRVRQQVRAVAVELFGATAVETPVPGYQVLTDSTVDQPLAAVRAAVLVRHVADGQVHDYALTARAAGHSWDEVADALGLAGTAEPAEDDDRTAAQRAFEKTVVIRDPLRSPRVFWPCGACEQRVSDHGPYESHPDDNEDGHADSCPRQRAAVAAWQRRREVEEGEF